MLRAVVDHMRNHLFPGKLYSMSSAVAGHVRGMSHGKCFLDPERATLRPQAMLDRSALELHSDVHNVLPEGQEREVFFKVVNAQPSKSKLIPLPLAAGSFLNVNHICVTFHQVSRHVMDDETLFSVDVQPMRGGSMNPMLVWHLEHEQLHEIVNSMKQWPRKRNLVFDIGSDHIVSGKCCEVLAMLVANSSGGLSTEQVPGAIRRQMETLLQQLFRRRT